MYREFSLPSEISLPSHGRNISALHVNSRSLAHRQDILAMFLAEFTFSFDVIVFSETWYQQHSEMLIIDGYSHFFLNHTGKRGGGIALHVKRGIHCDVLEEFTCTTPHYEVLSVKSDNILFVVIYRPPTGNVSNFLEFTEKLLEQASFHKYKVLLGGDFNINMLDDGTSTRATVNLMDSLCFCSVIKTPTRVTASCRSALDNFIVNAGTQIYTAGTISYDISDHCQIYVVCSFYVNEKCLPDTTFSYRCLSKENMQHFRALALRTDWSSLYNTKDASEAYGKFLSIFTHLYNLSFPLKKGKVKKRIRKPWVQPQHVTMISKKNRLFNRFLRTREESDLVAFKKLRNAINKELRKAKANYYETLFASVQRKNPEKTWKIINDAIRPKNVKQPFHEVTLNNEKVTGVSLTERFNNHFVNMMTSSDSAVTGTALNRCMHSIFFEPTDDTEISRTFLGLKNSNAVDADGIQIRLIKLLIDVIVIHLAFVFNFVLETGHFLSAMKKARVSVIFKGGNRNDLGNYMPISILSTFSKGLEKVISARINDFFLKNNILSDCQPGFRPGRSTETALLCQKELIIDNIDAGKLTLGIQ